VVDHLRVALVSVWVLLALGSAFGLVLIHGVGTETARDIGTFLYLGTEIAPGTWVASMLFITCSLLAAIGALVANASDQRWTRSWLLLAVVFCVLSLDEVANIHERLSPRISALVGDPSGVLTFAWVIPAVALGVAFLVVEIPFLRHLGPAGRRLVVAGIVFVAGAVGLEMIEGDLSSRGNDEALSYGLLVTAEELLEFGALMWATLILLEYLRQRLGSPRVLAAPLHGSSD
jgi:hypothetical protein